MMHHEDLHGRELAFGRGVVQRGPLTDVASVHVSALFHESERFRQNHQREELIA